MKKVIFILTIALVSLGTKAQEVDFTLGADVVSSYVWRGGYGTSAAIQPGAELTVGDFSISAWASAPFKGVDKEVDFTIAYEIAGLSLAITDYLWEGEGAFKYFSYGKDKTAHLFEATIGYELPIEKFPLSLSVNTMFAGNDYKADGDRAYSTYIEAAYPFSINSIDLGVSLGFTPADGLYADDFSVVSIGLKASKELKITDSFSLPIFGEIITNPRTEDIFFVFGISF